MKSIHINLRCLLLISAVFMPKKAEAKVVSEPWSAKQYMKQMRQQQIDESHAKMMPYFAQYQAF